MTLLNNSFFRTSYIRIFSILGLIVKTVTFYDLRLWYVVRRYGAGSQEHYRFIVSPEAEYQFKLLSMVTNEIYVIADVLGLEHRALKINVLHHALFKNAPLPTELESVMPLLVQRLPALTAEHARLQAVKILTATGEFKEWSFIYALGGEEAYHRWLKQGS